MNYTLRLRFQTLRGWYWLFCGLLLMVCLICKYLFIGRSFNPNCIHCQCNQFHLEVAVSGLTPHCHSLYQTGIHPFIQVYLLSIPT